MRNTRLVSVGLALTAVAAACGGTIATTGSGGSSSSSTSTSTSTGFGAGTSTSTSTATSTSAGVGGASSTTSSTTTTTTTTTGVGGSSFLSSTSTSSSSSSGACAPTAACSAADKTCLGLVDNAGKTTFGLRMAELDLTTPPALATGIVASILGGDIMPDDMACNLDGQGLFSWLLQFDTTAGTLKTGGARPVTDPTLGYAFDDEMITQGTTTFQVQPVTYQATIGASGQFSTATGQYLVMPIFLDASGTSVVLLPLQKASFTMGTLSASHDCIGSYNAAGLQPSNSCQPDSTHPQFIDGATLSGYITLANADEVIIMSLDETLCVLLSGNSSVYGTTGPTGVQVCTRNANGDILYQGNWCDATNAAATSTCADSVSVSGNFAASSVLITN